jgi:hypothetical protein
MGIKDVFKTNPAKLQADLEAKLRARTRDRDIVAEQLRTFEAKVIERRDAARALVRDGDGDGPKLTAIENEMRAAQDRVKTLSDGLLDIDSNIAELQREIAAEIDQEQRAKSAATIDDWTEEWLSAANLFDIGCKAVEAISALTAPTVPEAGGTLHFAKDARGQLPAAVAMIISCLKSHKASVLAGGGNASLAMPQAPAPPLKLVEAPQTREVVALRHIRWVNAEGTVSVAGKLQRCRLPVALVDHAMQSNAVCAVGDPRVRDGQIGLWGMLLPDQSRCDWLGPPLVAKAAPPKTGGAVVPIAHSAFEPLDRGPAYNITVPRPPEPVAMGARTAMPDDDA